MEKRRKEIVTTRRDNDFKGHETTEIKYETQKEGGERKWHNITLRTLKQTITK